MLFRTIGLEQNLYEPNVVVNRVAFLVFGLIPGEVVLDGTFEAMTEDLADPNAQPAAEEEEETTETRDGAGGTDTSPGEGESTPPNDAEGGGGGEKEKEKEKAYEREVVVKKGYGVDDGMTVRAFFAPPKIKFGGFPAFSVGPKRQRRALDDVSGRANTARERQPRVAVRVHAEDERRRGERPEAVGRGRAGRDGVPRRDAWIFRRRGRRFTAGGVTELSVATAVAVVVSFAMALVMRQGGSSPRTRTTTRSTTPSSRKPRRRRVVDERRTRASDDSLRSRNKYYWYPRGGSLRQLKSTTSSSSMS